MTTIAVPALSADPALVPPTLGIGVTIGVPPLSAAAAVGYPSFVGTYGSPGGVSGVLGASGPTPLRVDMQGGLIDLTPYLTSLSIGERMGSPDTMSITLADVIGVIPLSVVTRLADIRARLGTEELFRGQITLPQTETYNHQQDDGVWVSSRTFTIQAESYERLVDPMLVSVLPFGSGRTMPDGSYSPTGGYSIGWGHSDADDVRYSLFGAWWAGPAVDVDSCVHATGFTPVHWVYSIDNTQLGADLDALAAIASPPTLVRWLDARMRFHWADGADPDQLDPAPADISCVAFGVGTVMSMTMTNKTDAQNLRGRAYVSGALPWACGIASWPGGTVVAPDAMISAGTAQTATEADAFAARFFASDSRVGFMGSALVPGAGEGGYDGWHKGQWVHVTDPGHDLDAYGCLIQGVTADLKTAGPVPLFEYQVDYGDAPRRSLASESAWPTIDTVQGPSVAYAMSTDPAQIVPKPGAPVACIAQLNDGSKGLSTPNIPCRWDLYIAGDLVADPTDSTQAYYLSDMTIVTDELGKAYATANCGDAYDPASSDDCYAQAITEEP
jgi:hypothetical protein